MISIDTIPTIWYWLIPTLCFVSGGICTVILFMRTAKLQKGNKKRFTYAGLALSIIALVLLSPFAFSIFTTKLTVSTDDPTNMQMIAVSHPAFLEGLNKVQMTPPSLFTLRGLFLSDSRGNYNPSDRSIYMNSEDINVWTWWHELGHHVWFIHMTTEEKQAWINHYEKQRALYSEGFYPTTYSKKNAREDFADSFMIYVGLNDVRGYMMDPTLPTGLDVNRRYILEGVIQRLTDCEPVNHLCYYNIPQIDEGVIVTARDTSND